MILETLRMVEDALSDGSYGVNVKLDEMNTASEFGSDAQPPDLVDVLNATEDAALAKGNVGSDWPLLVLSQSEPAEVAGLTSQGLRDGSRVPIALAYVTRDPDGAQATRDALYTMRAVLKCLGDWFNQPASTDRKLQSIAVLDISGIRWAEIEEDLESGAIARALMVADIHVRDESAT